MTIALPVYNAGFFYITNQSLKPPKQFSINYRWFLMIDQYYIALKHRCTLNCTAMHEDYATLEMVNWRNALVDTFKAFTMIKTNPTLKSMWYELKSAI